MRILGYWRCCGYGYRIPFLWGPPLSKVPISMPSHHPLSTKRLALGEVTQVLIAKSAVDLAPLPSLGFYSHLFVVWKTSWSWRPVIDLSTVNIFVDVSHFRMETIQSVLLSVHHGDWMASIDLKEAYLQVPVHPDSCCFLRFVAQGRVYQFSALCFGLSTAPQVFSQVMAPVSAIPHSWGIRMRLYLDDWLVQSSSRDSLLHDLQVVLDLCHELGIVVNPEKSHLEPSQVVQYLGVVIDTRSFRASPSPDRVARLLSTAGEFLSCADPPASTWLSLLSMLSSLSHLVPGGRLRVRSLQLCLHRSRGSVSQDPLVSGLPQGSSVVASPSPSNVRGVSAASLSRSGLLVRHLRRGLGSSLRFTHRFRPLESGSKRSLYQRQGASSHPRGSPPLPVFSGREECVSVLRQQHRGVLSPQGRGHQVSLPQLSDSGFSVGPNPSRSACYPSSSRGLSRPHQLPHTEWSLHLEVFQSLSHLWPVQIDLFATSDNRHCSVYFSPFRDPMSAGTDAFFQSWDGLQAYAFPPWSIIPRALAKLRMSQGTELTLVAPYWPQRAWFPDLLHLSLAPPVALPLRQDLLRLPRSHCLYQGLHWLRLHAWRDSGASRELQGSHPL